MEPALPSPRDVPGGWYCLVMGTELGPMTHDDLLLMVRTGQLTPEDQIRQGSGDWHAATSIGLFD